MRKLLLAGILSVSAMAATSYTTSIYGGYIDYSGTTTKDEGSVGGIYLSAFESPWKVELDAEHTNIKYKSSIPKLKQTDLTAKINYYQGYNLAYNIGFHYIDTTDKPTDEAKIYMAGILYYKTLKYNAGVDIYYSDYSNLSTSPKLYQISPKAGFNFGNYSSAIGSFYAEAKIDYIAVSKNKDENNLKNSYTSVELTLNNYNGNFTTSISGWSGKRVYAVENNGFVVNNLNNEQKYGFKISENYKIDKAQSVKIEYAHTKFEDNGDSKSNNIIANYSYSF